MFCEKKTFQCVAPRKKHYFCKRIEEIQELLCLENIVLKREEI